MLGWLFLTQSTNLKLSDQQNNQNYNYFCDGNRPFCAIATAFSFSIIKRFFKLLFKHPFPSGFSLIPN